MTIKRGEIYYIQSYGNECGSEQRAVGPQSLFPMIRAIKAVLRWRWCI